MHSFEDTVREFAEQLPEHFDLVGYSMGARLALGIIALQPTRVRRALLIGVHPGITDEEARRRRVAWEHERARAIERDYGQFVAEWEKMPLFATQHSVGDDRRAAQRAQRSEHTARGVAWAMRQLGLGAMPAYWSALANSPMPITLATGALDEKFSQLAARAPGVEHVIIPGSGHNVVLEAPDALRKLYGNGCPG